VRFGVLAKERCTGDVARRSGNDYIYQELARATIDDLKAAGPKTIVASCPHCVRTIGTDYRKFGFEVRIVHTAVFVEELTRGGGAGRMGGSDAPAAASGGHAGGPRRVVYHDPCYLGRYEGHVDEPRALLARLGVEVVEPVRSGANPFCCGAGGGLLFADTDEVPGSRMSDVRFTQLRDTGADTVVTACPFCSIMLKGAQATAGADVQVVDLMTFVSGRLPKA
jgi:Fe-S oxidoreductase